jgi:hypothetical protein
MKYTGRDESSRVNGESSDGFAERKQEGYSTVPVKREDRPMNELTAVVKWIFLALVRRHVLGYCFSVPDSIVSSSF